MSIVTFLCAPRYACTHSHTHTANYGPTCIWVYIYIQVNIHAYIHIIICLWWYFHPRLDMKAHKNTGKCGHGSTCIWHMDVKVCMCVSSFRYVLVRINIFLSLYAKINNWVKTHGTTIISYICIYACIHMFACIVLVHIYMFLSVYMHISEFICPTRGGGLGSRPKKMYGERLGDGVEYHLMKPTPRR